jgi:RNA polymerase sigma-70 factor, ECF subfamily
MPRTPFAMHAAETDASLIDRARRGEREAFDELVRRHFAPVYRMLHRRIGNHEDALDLAQECFVRAWGALAWYRADAPFGAWLYRVALHLAHDHQRASLRRGARASAFAEQIPATSGDPSDSLGRRELSERLAAALERLPERLRDALVLRVLEGLEYDDVARVTGVTPATARTHVMQARKRLLQWLGPWLGSGGGMRRSDS